MQLVLHSPFGSRINRAWGLALRKRFCRKFNFELQAAATEDAIVLSLGPTHSFPLDEVFHYLKFKTVRQLLCQALLDAPMWNIRWRWNVTRSLCGAATSRWQEDSCSIATHGCRGSSDRNLSGSGLRVQKILVAVSARYLHIRWSIEL